MPRLAITSRDKIYRDVKMMPNNMHIDIRALMTRLTLSIKWTTQNVSNMTFL